MVKKNIYTTIKIKKTTAEKIRSFGRYDESADDIVSRIVNAYEAQMK